MAQVQLVSQNHGQLDDNQRSLIIIQTKGPFCFEKNGVVALVENRRQNKWNMQEKIKHLAFADHCGFSPLRGQDHVSWQIFEKMSTFIKTKNANQCRIYHKRSIHKYTTISNLIAEIKKETPQLSKIMREYQRELNKVHANHPKQQKCESPVNNCPKALDNTYQIKIENLQLNQQSKIFEKSDEVDKIQAEKEKLDIIKTNTTCKEQAFEEKNERTQFKTMLNTEKSQLMNPFSQALLNQGDIQQNSFPLFAGFQYPFYFKPNFSSLQQNHQNWQQWQECFELYSAWTSKLSQLMGKYD